jgi:hypothetical protein
MRSGGIVIASNIPVHREVFADAAAYFDPYDREDAAAVIGGVLMGDGGAERARLRAAGVKVSERYTAPSIGPKWEAFFQTLCRG